MASRTEEHTPFQNALLIALAVIFPPIPVFILDNYCVLTKPMLITVLLTIFGHIPGVIFAIYYILEYSKFNLRLGYVRLDEELEVPSGANHVDHPPVDVAASSSSEPLVTDQPPHYQDVVSEARGVDSKSDNKVQNS